ncbi:MAG: hypothetical protein HY606_07525 [Planctomycetes bacterium]|nr:hypothetical protein [Planctomycetota bacterium]
MLKTALSAIITVQLLGGWQVVPKHPNPKNLHVPAAYPTIQSAVDASKDGDTIIIAPGTYTGPGNRDIVIDSKSITVTSSAGPYQTIIDIQGSAQNMHWGFSIKSTLLTAVNPTTVTINGLTIQNGYFYGGVAINTRSVHNVAVIGNIIKNNIALWGGGAVHILNSDCNISYNLFQSNSSDLTAGYGDGGGAILIRNFFSLKNLNIIIKSNFLIGNTSYFGGGIYINSSYSGGISGAIEQNFIYQNQAVKSVPFLNQGNGGGLHVSTFASVGLYLLIRNNIISGNIAQNNGGGMYFDISSEEIDINIVNNTITKNNAYVSGGGIYNEIPLIQPLGIIYNMMVANSIIWGNCIGGDCTSQIPGAEMQDLTGTLLWAMFSDIRFGWPGPFNINSDPLLTPDFQLSSFSPCIDSAGSTFYPETDFLGKPRYDDKNVTNTGCCNPPYVDMGAIERQTDS